jgi:threonine dehydrogenase-like Zn-dependent dehydrogenase
VGISHGRPGALADQVAVPVSALRTLPEGVDYVMGALVEPGGNALRAFRAANVAEGERLLVIGAGTIGLLVAMFARSSGVDVHLLGRSDRSVAFSRSLGFDQTWTEDSLPKGPWHGVVDASNSDDVPALAVKLVEPGRHIALIGIAATPSPIDSRSLTLNDMTAVGILSGSPGLDGTIAAYASGSVDPRPLVAATVALDAVAAILAGDRPAGAGDGPKFHVDIAAQEGRS